MFAENVKDDWFWWYIRWIKVPAIVFLFLWTLGQVVVVFRQMGGISNISGLGHAGGALVGLIFFILYRKKKNVFMSTLQ